MRPIEIVSSAKPTKITSIKTRRRWRGAVVSVLSLLVMSECSFGGDGEGVDNGESSEVADVLSPNPCTAVILTSPAQNFTGTVGVPILLTGAATCPAGQTPEYQYWVKLFSASAWTILGSYVPGSSTWTPPSDNHWCVSVAARAIGAPESYQVRSSANCTAPRCGNGVVEAGEQCDDGNAVNGDACDNNCTTPRCGNGAVDPGEQCDDGNAVNGDACDNNCTTPRCGNGIVDPGEQCDDGNAVNGDACDNSCVIPGLAYLKASNANEGDGFGENVAISADGLTLAVSASGESSAATGINGDQADNSAYFAGAVYVFTRSGMTWSQQAYIKASNTERDDQFGRSVALSADGTTLAVGASGEASSATGINGDQADNFAYAAGAVYVYTRSGTTWSQQAYVKASNTGRRDVFGRNVALSGNGSTLAVGAIGESSAATGVGGNQADNSARLSGAVYVYTRSGTTWSQQAYVKASNTGASDDFGTRVALSGDGSTLAVSADQEDSAATGVNGNQADNSAPNAGAVYVYTRSGTTWSQQAYVKASNTGVEDQFGSSVALSANGSTLAVGAVLEDSSATGIDGNQANNAARSAGAVYLFTRSGTTWSQQAYVKASNTGAADEFGYNVALSANGSTLAVSAIGEASAAVGSNGNQADNSAPGAGAAYEFTRSGTTWSQQAYIKASNTDALDYFGYGLALSGDGATLVVGAIAEDSAATGIGGNQADNTASSAGAAYVFR